VQSYWWMWHHGQWCDLRFVKYKKLNTQSSTRAELVRIDYMMSKVLWTQYFLKTQGYDMPPAVIYQDNKSTMLLAKNGTWSRTNRTRHIDVQYSFIADRIAKQEVTIKYCPTSNMMSDLLTKPLQGSVFCKFALYFLTFHLIQVFLPWIRGVCWNLFSYGYHLDPFFGNRFISKATLRHNSFCKSI
jgi:hypothetical protein